MEEMLRASRVIKKVKQRVRHDDRESIASKVRRWQQLRTPLLPPEIVEIGAWEPRWAAIFAGEKKRILAVLREERVGAVEHIGSTSIPGLTGKPIIDLLVAVPAPIFDPPKTDAFAAAGYTSYGFSPCDPEVLWLWKVGDDRASVVHLCELANPWIRTAVNFRDYMRSHPDDRVAYEECKRRLAADPSLSLFEYSMEKLILFYEISVKADAWAQER